jgi:sigma-B regulation protein RsbU (phosphoserine phosphatase)
MRFRWKLLVVLIVIALFPIIVMRFLGISGVRRLSQELIQRSEKNLIAETQSRLRLLTDSYSQMLSQAGDQLRIALLWQATEVERALARTDCPQVRAHFAADFNAKRDLPPDTTLSPDHFRLENGVEKGLLDVSFATQVFQTAPGTDPGVVRDAVDRLAALTPFYRRLYRQLEGLVLWQFTCLENGLQGSYPGHSGIPEDFDGRRQFWYREAFNTESLWTDQYTDPVTGQNVIAISMPIKGQDGQTIGVTAMAIPTSRLFERRLLLENTPPATRSFIVYLETQKDSGRRGARILARADFTRQKLAWRTPVQADWLIPDEEEALEPVLDDFAAGRGGFRRIRYNNCDCLWVYGPLERGGELVLITPYEAMLQPVRDAGDYISRQIEELLVITRYGILTTLAIVLVLAFGFSRTVTRPMRALAWGARELARGRFDTRVDIRSHDEFGEMGKVFNSVGPQLEEHYHMRHSLELAMEVQQNLLPTRDPSIAGLDIAGRSIYCEETGGDYYDYLDTGSRQAGRIGVVVGDVSGHGISSALVMTTARALLRQRIAMPGSLKEVVSDVNRQLSKDIQDSGQFMTLFCAEFDPAAGKLRWVRAGHDPALYFDSRSRTFEELGGQGAALGVSLETDFEELGRDIQPGHLVVMGTDGIWEARNGEGRMFGKETLQQTVRRHAGESAREIMEAVIAELERFRHPLAKTEDDITLVIVKVSARGADTAHSA